MRCRQTLVARGVSVVLSLKRVYELLVPTYPEVVWFELIREEDLLDRASLVVQWASASASRD